MAGYVALRRRGHADDNGASARGDGSCQLISARGTARDQVSREPRDMTKYSFLLFVAGQGERSLAAESNLRALCDARLSSDYDIEIVDAAERPDVAEADRILATPTVIRTAPLPRRRVIGNLSDSRRAGDALGLPDAPASGTETSHD